MMPDVDYVGFDTELSYIKWAKKKYAGKGIVYCESYTQQYVNYLAPFDVILLFGVLHHCNDETCADLIPMLLNSLKPDGRIITLDPCFTSDQSAFSKFIGKIDRGRYVRTQQGYETLVKSSFLNIQSEIFHNICRIPTTEIIMCLTK